jgi:hypothetical protein
VARPGTNEKSYDDALSVSFSTPWVVLLRTSLFGGLAVKGTVACPPVPTTNWRIPKAGSAAPLVDCGANRS